MPVSLTAVKGDHTYPADEFDAASSRIRPLGTHRSPPSRWRRVLPYLVVLVVFPLLAYGVVTWLSDSDVLPVVGPTEQGEAGTADEPSTGDAGTDTGAEAGQDGSGDTTDDPAATTAPTAPVPEPDLSRPVEVYNATNRTGLAAGAADQVRAAGFTSVTSGNWSDEDPPSSVVRYSAEDDLGTAQAVAGELGIELVERSEDQSADGVVAILADDYDT